MAQYYVLAVDSEGDFTVSDRIHPDNEDEVRETYSAMKSEFPTRGVIIVTVWHDGTASFDNDPDEAIG